MSNLRALEVAFVWTGDRSASYLSGMPWAMEHALRRQGLSIRPLVIPLADAPGGDLLSRMRGARGADALTRAAVRPLRFARRRLRAVRENLRPDATAARMLAGARERSERLTRALAGGRHDAVFGCCISAVLSHARFDAPLVYFSDATAKRINREYPEYAARGRGYHRACDELERAALARCARGAFASEWARSSAVDDYGLAADRASVVPMGANITPADLGGAPDSIEGALRPVPPTRDDLRLCIVASDPHRKGVDLAVRAAETLRAGGWRATVDIVGPRWRTAARSHAARCVGRLDLSREPDRRRLAGIMARAHIHLLPSRAEAFGIAACEAAHFARPAVVSDAGGLGTIVRDGETGRVLPNGADGEAYAHAILAIAEDRTRYTAMGHAARERAERTLNWDAWGSTMGRLVRDAAHFGRAGRALGA
jgi:glycosyltransferase involved in cell wall biosynthesis